MRARAVPGCRAHLPGGNVAERFSPLFQSHFSQTKAGWFVWAGLVTELSCWLHVGLGTGEGARPELSQLSKWEQQEEKLAGQPTNRRRPL